MLPVILDDALATRVQVEHLRIEVVVANPDVSLIELVLDFNASGFCDLENVCPLNLVLTLLVFVHCLYEWHKVGIYARRIHVHLRLDLRNLFVGHSFISVDLLENIVRPLATLNVYLI